MNMKFIYHMKLIHNPKCMYFSGKLQEVVRT
jgi:hypothetical protein